MKCPLIVIDHVQNGWIVSLPPNEPNQFEMIGAGIKQFMPSHDPMLESKKEPESILDSKQEHVFIFETFEQVLAFLANKFIQK